MIFGNPKAGTPVMQAAPLAALDLPLKVLVWDDGGQTKLTYHRAGGTGRALRASRTSWPRRLAGIDALTDAVIAD